MNHNYSQNTDNSSERAEAARAGGAARSAERFTENVFPSRETFLNESTMRHPRLIPPSCLANQAPHTTSHGKKATPKTEHPSRRPQVLSRPRATLRNKQSHWAGRAGCVSRASPTMRKKRVSKLNRTAKFVVNQRIACSSVSRQRGEGYTAASRETKILRDV